MNGDLVVEPGLIHPLRDGFVVALSTSVDLTKTKVDEDPLPLSGMLEVRPIRRDEEIVGYFLHTGFRTIAGGAYLIALLKSKAGKATQAKTVLRHGSFVVVDLVGCGTMAIVSDTNSSITTLLREQ